MDDDEEDRDHAVYSDAHFTVAMLSAADEFCRKLAQRLVELMPEVVSHQITGYRADGGEICALIYYRVGKPQLMLDFIPCHFPLDFTRWEKQLKQDNHFEVPVSDMVDALLIAQHIALLVLELQNS